MGKLTNNNLTHEEKKKSLDQTILQIEKKYGSGSIMKLNGKLAVVVDTISTGSLPLDIALGIGGLPRGRVIEIFGPESSGKTTLTLHALAEAQKLGGTAAFIDAEHALDSSYAEKLGVNVEELMVTQPDSGEQALEIAELLVRSNAVDIIVVDSVAALVPKSEIEGEMGAPQMGLQARLMSQALRKLTSAVHKANTTIIFINQIRMKIGPAYGSPETTTGGNALKFYSSIRLDIRRIEKIQKDDQHVGIRVRVKVVKNKMAAPFKKTEFDISFSKGISRESCILEEAVKLGFVKKAGTWYSIGESKIGQGKENAKKYLTERADLTQRLENKIREHHGIPNSKKALSDNEMASVQQSTTSAPLPKMAQA